MGKRKFAAITILIGLVVVPSGVCVAQKPSSSGSVTSGASEAWQKEFDEICSKTQDAMMFSPAELKVLLQRSDALEPKIEKLDETRKKVYLKRLRQCRGLFSYVLESKTKDNKK